MRTVKLRLILAWVIGVFSSIVVGLIFLQLSDAMGLHTSIDYDQVISFEGGSFVNDGERYSTSLGTWINIVSFTIGARIGMWFFTKNWRGGTDQKGLLFLLLVMIGLTVYTALITIAWNLIADKMLEYEYIRFGSELAVVVGLFFGLRSIYRWKVCEWEE